MRLLLIAFAIALFCTAAVTPFVARFARKLGVIDQPGGRRVHSKPTPRWGGIAIVFGFWAAVGLVWWTFGGWSAGLSVLLIGGTIVACFGLLDDVFHFGARVQTVFLLLVGLGVAHWGVRIEGITNPLAPLLPGQYQPNHWWPLGVWSVPVTALWIFVVTKTFDTIDGLDGLAAGVGAITALTLMLMAQSEGQFVVALPAAALCGACVGFLVYNVSPAAVFMSTVGSQFLGFVLAVVSITGAFKVAAAVSLGVPILVFGIPLFDAVFVALRRLAAGEPVTQADNRHLHYTLSSLLGGHRRAVFVIWLMAIVLCGVALALFTSSR